MEIASLPPHLAERVRWYRGPLPSPTAASTGAVKPPRGTTKPEPADRFTGDFVLYWMHHAVRGHENPSLDVAIRFANDLGLPLLVYHALCEQYPYASDRHHAFILQGARDVQRELNDLGVAYRFHLQREGHRGAHLRDLARRAAVLVSDEMPVGPIVGWLGRLATMCTAPILCVDSSCVVPLPLIDRAYTRAFEYRKATADLYSARLNRPYPVQPVDCQPFCGSLPFEPLDLQDADLAALIGSCQIDHSIAAVSDTPGGSRSGYARWTAFRDERLKKYSRCRNDAADHGGVSRMSGYLHFGMVSPFRIAREAAGAGAEKFLDELLIWRELAFHFCHHVGEQIDSLDAIPDWARQTLAAHASDCRESIFPWETLSRGVTGQPLWDLCQQSLLRHGELHNNVRMTWGKALIGWATSPAQALHLAIDLNHRYALDGRDPSSYGGLLWCFGQFDRRFEPERSVLGTVRPRPIESHMRRIDLAKYRSVVTRPIAARPPSVAIVGAGLAGLVAARTLADHGLDVRLFDKSRGVGGRMSTRRTKTGLRFDHGAQYFTARDCRFARYVRSWVDSGLVDSWSGRVVQLRNAKPIAEKSDTARYVGCPGMNAVAKHLAEDLDCRLSTHVQALRRRQDRWELSDDTGGSLGRFDRVIINCPPAQTAVLLHDHSHLAERISAVKMNPCWAVMLQLAGASGIDFDGAFVDDSPLSWICRNNSKPGRSGDGETWVLHASAAWSAEHLEAEAASVCDRLVAAWREQTGVPAATRIETAIAHRWRYAIPDNPLPEDCLWDAANGLGACGDWCGGPRIEGAFLSGIAVAGALLRQWTIDRPTTDSQHPLFLQGGSDLSHDGQSAAERPKDAID